MKKVLLTLAIIISLVLVAFSGIFYENFGIIRGLRAKELLTLESNIASELELLVAPANEQRAQITMQYSNELRSLGQRLNRARNTYGKLPTEIKTNEEGLILKAEYLYYVYEIALLGHEYDKKIAEIRATVRTNVKELRITNLIEKANSQSSTNITMESFLNHIQIK